jgi:hypothetical protein
MRPMTSGRSRCGPMPNKKPVAIDVMEVVGGRIDETTIESSGHLRKVDLGT